MGWDHVKVLEDRIVGLEKKIMKISTGIETGLGSDFIFPGIRRGLEKKIINTNGVWTFGEGWLFSVKTNSNGNFQSTSYVTATLNIDNSRIITVRSSISGNTQQNSGLVCDLTDIGNAGPPWEELSGTIQGFEYTYNIPLHFDTITVNFSIGTAHCSGHVILVLL